MDAQIVPLGSFKYNVHALVQLRHSNFSYMYQFAVQGCDPPEQKKTP